MYIRIIAILIFSTLIAGCYKVKNTPIDKSSPTYKIIVNNIFNLKDTAVTENVSQGDSSLIYLQFELISGDPTNYNFSCYLSNLPNGTTAKPDTINFKLNTNCMFHIFSTSIADTGLHNIMLNVNSTLYGHEQYTLKLHVRAKY